MRSIIFILLIFLLCSYAPDECDIKEINYLMDKIEYKAKYEGVDKDLIKEWLCINQNVNCI